MATTLAQSLRADPVSRLELRPVCSVDAATPIDQTLRCMLDARTGCALVTEGGQLVMTRSPRTIGHTDSIQNAIEIMEGGGYRHLPVLGEDTRPAGVLSVKDVVHHLVGYFPANVYNLPPSPQLTQPAREGA
jgi:CBS domain-containing protein